MTLRLNIINSMLSTTGTSALVAEDSQHPAYIAANNILNDVIEDFSSQRLWFNTSYRTLMQNSDGRVVVPSNALTCDPADQSKDYVIRGQYLFDMGNFTDVLNEDVDCIVVTEMDLEDMPPVAIQFIKAHARLAYYIDVDGSASKVQMYQATAAGKAQELVTMNMQHTGANFFNGRGYASFATRRTVTARPITHIQ